MRCFEKSRFKGAVASVKDDIGGYTLLEMLLVVIILAIVVSISIPYVNIMVADSREKSDIAAIRRACAKYEADYYLGGSPVVPEDGGSVQDFLRSVADGEDIELYFDNDGGYGAMPISVADGCADITYKPRHANSGQEYHWRLKIGSISLEDEERAPDWTPEPPMIPEPADP